jgi:hypothetical protein
MKKLILVVFALFFALPAFAQVSTSDMVNYCKSSQRIDAFINADGDTTHFSTNEWLEDGLCIGFFRGLADGVADLAYIQDGEVFEIQPSGKFTYDQMIQFFVEYTTAHPELLKQPVTVVAVTSLLAENVLTLKPIGVLAPPTKKPASESTPAPSHQQTAQLNTNYKENHQ